MLLRRHRAGLVLLALFQLAFPVFASVADARAEVKTRGAVVHVESHGTRSCVPPHAADCALCRVISGGATVSRSLAVQLRPGCGRAVALPGYQGQVAARRAGHGPSQRAPPIA